MPRKLGDLFRDLAKTGWQLQKGGKMKSGDAYLKWVEWSEEDKMYVGRCPDLFFGGCHGDDPIRVYAELCET